MIRASTLRTRLPRRASTTAWKAGRAIVAFMSLFFLAAAPIAHAEEGAVGAASSDPSRWLHFPGTRGSGEGPFVVAVAREWDGIAQVAIADATGVRKSRLANTRGGVRQGESLASVERVAEAGVRDLAFDRSGRLWIATATGLRVWPRGERPTRRSLRGGEGADGIHRVETHGEAILLATDAGAFWSSSGGIFQPLAGEGAGTSVRLAAIRPLPSTARVMGQVGPEELEIWLVGEGALVVIRGLVTPVGLRVLSRRRIALPRPSSERAPRDLVFVERVHAAKEGRASHLLLLYPDAIAALEVEPPAGPARGEVVGSRWTIHRPVLAPGAEMNRIAARAGGFGSGRDGEMAIVTNRGLYLGSTLEGPFRRAPTPMGTEACSDLGGGVGGPLFIACRSGLHAYSVDAASAGLAVSAGSVGSLGSAHAGTLAGGVSAEGPPRQLGALKPILPLESDPPLAEIRRRVLAHAGLDAERGRSLWRGLRRRGYWPELGLRFGADFDRGDRRFNDQAFTSGALHRLRDVTRERDTAFEVSIDLDWNLGDVAYPEDAVDLSRELRQVIGLRDDVSDELAQLYSERQRIRARLASGEPLASAEVVALRSRAEELFAGLDAWTGGWLTQWRRDHARPHSNPTLTPHEIGPDVMSPTRKKTP